MTRREIAAQILAGIAANPSDAHVQGPVAARKAVELADLLLSELSGADPHLKIENDPGTDRAPSPEAQREAKRHMEAAADRERVRQDRQWIRDRERKIRDTGGIPASNIDGQSAGRVPEPEAKAEGRVEIEDGRVRVVGAEQALNDAQFSVGPFPLFDPATAMARPVEGARVTVRGNRITVTIPGDEAKRLGLRIAP